MGCSHSSAATTRTAKQSRSAKQSRAVCAGLPVVGILRCDGARWECAQAIVSAADRAEYHYRIVYAVVEGLPYQHVRAGKPLSASQEEALRVAVEELDLAECVCITGDCGSFVHYQGLIRSRDVAEILAAIAHHSRLSEAGAVRSLTTRAVVLSPLVQASLIATMYQRTEKAIVVTNDTNDYSQADLEQNLAAEMMSTAQRRAWRRHLWCDCD